MNNSFYDVSRFPALQELFEQWETVRDELLSLDAPLMQLHRFGKPHEEVVAELAEYVAQGNSYGWMEGWDEKGANPDWLQYVLAAFDRIIPYVDPKLGRTVAMLEKIDGIKVCAFSMLKSGAMLPVHAHPEINEENLLQMHLPLVTAEVRNHAYLNVAGEFRQFVRGEPIVFDGSSDHFVLNASPVDRVILYMEFSRRLLAT